MEKQHLEDLMGFLRQHRSNEANFDKIHTRLEEEISTQNDNANYLASLKEIKEKQVEEYLQSKKEGTTTWPEFEKIVSEFEKLLTEHLKASS